MNPFIDINNRELLKDLLSSLQPDTKPLWGAMKPQQMVEHLIDQVQYTNGKKNGTCDVPANEAEKSKNKGIYTDSRIPKNVVLGTLPDHYEYDNLQAAIDQLMTELLVFDEYFNSTNAVAIHGGFGPMNYYEWQIWHNKHFTHHLMQFGLLP
jgi:uncharacterized protein YhfF